MNLLSLLLLPTGYAATLTVNADGSGDHSSVQAAVDAASSGDTISIGPGTFEGAVSVSAKTLYIQGSGIGGTVLQGDGSETVLAVQGAGLNLAQLTLSGGSQGLDLSGVVGSIETVELRDNTGASAGGGIAIRNGSDVNMVTVYIEDNGAESGGGLHLDASSQAEISGAWIANNSASDSGGGVHSSGNLTLTESTVRDNEASVHGGGLFATGISPDITTSAFWGNTAGENGGGIAIASTSVGSVSPRVKQTELWLNEAGNDGGAIYMNGAASFFVREVLAVLNIAGNDGGGVWVSGGQPSTTFLRAWHNEAGNDGGGGYFTENNGGMTRRSSFGGNVAGNQGGGAAHSNANNNHYIYNNRYLENRAEAGAGLLVDGDTNKKMSVSNVDAVGNAGGGIAIQNSALAKVVNSIVVFNDGDGIEADATSASAITLKFNNVFENTDSYGGALADREGSEGNIGSDPLFTRFDADEDPISDFLYLAESSPCLNTGKADILNRDGTRSHMGSYGGPDAEGGDEDGDGVGPMGGDCDDGDPLSVPGAEEIAGDGRDNDCAGGGELDLDGDGYLHPIDCDDSNDAVYPGAEDVTGDGIDADCDGADGDEPVADDTGEGPPAGADTGAPWVDEDTGVDDPYEDADRDGFTEDEDCNDADASANPDADEVCDDGIDNDCDGQTDDSDADCKDGETKGCGCASTGTLSSAPWWTMVILGLIARRRTSAA